MSVFKPEDPLLQDCPTLDEARHRDLCRELLHQLEVQPPWLKSDAQRLFDEKIPELHRQGGITPVAAVAEAHLWDADMLEEIRFLTNYSADAASPLALIVCGQPELRNRLRVQKHAAIRQRVEIWFHLQGMQREETREYIGHHMEVVEIQISSLTWPSTTPSAPTPSESATGAELPCWMPISRTRP